MSYESEGGPAFPSVLDSEKRENIEYGMTLRDYFATRAMQSLAASERCLSSGYKQIAIEAYELADEMIAQRAGRVA